jgi:hypothetical protein
MVSTHRVWYVGGQLDQDVALMGPPVALEGQQLRVGRVGALATVLDAPAFSAGPEPASGAARMEIQHFGPEAPAEIASQFFSLLPRRLQHVPALGQ